MSAELRNPYVILGVPFGASEAEARTGFAKASRRLRDPRDHRYTMEDLTWALHQVEQILDDPAKAFSVYRIPANPQVTDNRAPGVFNPEARPIERTTRGSTDAEMESVKLWAVQEVIVEALKNSNLDIEIPQPYEQKEHKSD